MSNFDGRRPVRIELELFPDVKRVCVEVYPDNDLYELWEDRIERVISGNWIEWCDMCNDPHTRPYCEEHADVEVVGQFKVPQP